MPPYHFISQSMPALPFYIVIDACLGSRRLLRLAMLGLRSAIEDEREYRIAKVIDPYTER